MNRDKIVEDLFDGSQMLSRSWKTHFFKVLGSENLSPAQIGVVFYIKKNQPTSGKDVAAEMQTSPSAVTQLIDALDQRGYITRKSDPNDRRVSYISLSEAGEAVMSQLEEKRKQFFVEVTQVLTNDEIIAMTAIQQKMLTQVDKKIAEAKGGKK